jgi:hypothetical protein
MNIKYKLILLAFPFLSISLNAYSEQLQVAAKPTEEEVNLANQIKINSDLLKLVNDAKVELAKAKEECDKSCTDEQLVKVVKSLNGISAYTAGSILAVSVAQYGFGFVDRLDFVSLYNMADAAVDRIFKLKGKFGKIFGITAATYIGSRFIKDYIDNKDKPIKDHLMEINQKLDEYNVELSKSQTDLSKLQAKAIQIRKIKAIE